MIRGLSRVFGVLVAPAVVITMTSVAAPSSEEAKPAPAEPKRITLPCRG